MELRIIIENVVTDDKKMLQEVSDKRACLPFSHRASRQAAFCQPTEDGCTGRNFAVLPTSAEQFRDRDV